uniref:Uncharacterized protein n=1 Tax=Solanum lycopersicum TaxID=4081 RepID=A0A3Q7FGP7_SOLLC
MSNMIAQLKSVGYVFSDEKQVHVVISSLPNNQEHLKVNLTYNDNILKILDVARHVELEDERLGAVKIASNAFVVESSGTKLPGFKRMKIEKGMEKTGSLRRTPKKNKKANSKKGNWFFQEERQEKKEVLQSPTVEVFRL